MVNFNFKSERGQILLVVVLAAVISLTVGLSAVSRTITNTKLTTDQTNSQRALSAAEAGVEELLKTGSAQNINGSPSNKADFNASATVVGGAADPDILINGDSKVLQHDAADIWLSDYPGYINPRTGTLKIYWTNNTNDSAKCRENAAIEVAVVTGRKDDPQNLIVKRYVFDPCPVRRAENSFDETLPDSPSGGTIDTRTFENSASIIVSSSGAQTGGLIARIIPLYADTYIGARGTNGLSLPNQGFLIESVGTSGTSKRKVRVFRGFPKLSVELFPYNIFLP